MSLPTASDGIPVSLDGGAVIQTTCITVHSEAEHAVVALSGELDLASAPQLQRVVHGLLARGHNCLTINLDEVTFID